MELLSGAKAVGFDLFGTLLVFPDFDEAQRLWIGAFHEQLGRRSGLSLERMGSLCAGLLESELTRESASGLSTYETRIQAGFGALGLPLTATELHAVSAGTLAAWQGRVHLAEDAILVLRELKRRHAIVLITNFDHPPHVRSLVDRLGLRPLLDEIIISDEVGCSKPQREIFELVLRRTQLAPSELVHVGDSIHDDIEGARAAGIRPILIDRKLKSHARYPATDVAAPPGLRTIQALSELLPPEAASM